MELLNVENEADGVGRGGMAKMLEQDGPWSIWCLWWLVCAPSDRALGLIRLSNAGLGDRNLLRSNCKPLVVGYTTQVVS